MDQRVTTGIPGLDRMLHGGFRPGSVNLIWGAPGAGKTVLALQFIYEGALKGERGLWVSFEEFPHSLYRDASSLGWDLRPLEQEGKLQLAFTSPSVFLQSLTEGAGPLNQFATERVVLDPISQLTRLTQDPQELRQLYYKVVRTLKELGVTSLLVGESNQPDFSKQDRGHISFMVDSIVTLNYVEVDSAIHRAVVVLKMRGSDHAKEIRRYEIRRGGIVVMEQFQNREGILSGMSRRTG
jgi:circadian clock protein KaiC